MYVILGKHYIQNMLELKKWRVCLLVNMHVYMQASNKRSTTIVQNPLSSTIQKMCAKAIAGMYDNQPSRQ